MAGKKDRLLYCATSLAALLAPGIAMAQEAADPPSQADIVVTAQRRAQNVVDVPLTVNLLSRSELNTRSVT